MSDTVENCDVFVDSVNISTNIWKLWYTSNCDKVSTDLWTVENCDTSTLQKSQLISEFENSRYSSIKIKSSDTTIWRRADYRATYRSLLLESKSSDTTIWRKADLTKGCCSLTIRRAHWLECWWSGRQIRDPTFCITYIWIYIYYNNFIAIYLKF